LTDWSSFKITSHTRAWCDCGSRRVKAVAWRQWQWLVWSAANTGLAV